MADFTDYDQLDNRLSSGTLATIINVVKTTVGSGIIGLPAACKESGYVNFGFSVVLVALLSYYSIVLLTEIGENMGVESYEQIAQKVIDDRFGCGKVGLRIAAAMVFISISVSACAYLLLLKAELPDIAKYLYSLLGNCTLTEDSLIFNGNFLMCVCCACLICPLCFAKYLDFLKYTSALGLFSMVFTIAIVVFFKFTKTCHSILMEFSISNNMQQSDSNQTCNYPPSSHSLNDLLEFDETLRNMSARPKDSCKATAVHPPRQIMGALLTIIYSFLNHDVILSIYAELRQKSKAKMQRVCKTSYVMITCLYLTIGYSGYFTWYEATVPEILLAYSHGLGNGPFIMLAKVLMVLSTTLSAPIVHYAGRKAVCMFIYGEYSMQEYDGSKRFRNLFLQYIYPICFFAIAAFLMSKSDAYGIILSVGGWTSSAVYLVFPPLLWLLCFCNSENKETNGTNTSQARIYANIAMLCLSSCFMLYEMKNGISDLMGV